jgi:hypothetical protein
MKTYTIKITGSGTLTQIRTALQDVVDDIHARLPELSGPKAEWEDPTLMTEIEEE